MSNSFVGETCGNCYGQGQVPTDEGSVTCPDCGGGGTLPSGLVAVEWRAIEIERGHASRDDQAAHDIKWLVFELRRARSALTSLLALAEDLADEPSTHQMRFLINQALGLYRVIPSDEPGASPEAIPPVPPVSKLAR